MKQNFIAIALAVVAVVIAVLSLIHTPNAKLGNGTQSFWDSALGYRVDGIEVVSGSAVITSNAGILFSTANSTSTTATTQTLSVADLAGYDTVLMTPNTGALTLTFPASSTASTWLPAAGDRQRTCFINSTTTAAATITFAAGTGIDLETASSSPSDLTLVAGNTACFDFIRQKSSAAAFDITAAMMEFSNGD